MERVEPNTKLGRIIEWSKAREATDLHGQAGKPFTIRVQGELHRVPTDNFAPPSELDILDWFRESFSSATCDRIESATELDLSFYYSDLRFRANFSKQKGQQSFSFRTVPQHQLNLAELQLPASLAELTQELRGLVLATGPTGQGKSTTLRALIQEINNTQALRIVTIEDPIEYVFEERLAQFEQREVGIDTASFADGIRNAMRQDPDVIFVGEIRDRESIFAAMQAAETGHLVLTTLHADTAAQAIARLREHYPTSEQESISSLLARNLRALICQRLIPNRQGSRTPCLAIFRRNAGIAKAIRTNDLELLAGIIEASVNEGMHTFDQYLLELHAAEVISRETAFISRPVLLSSAKPTLTWPWPAAARLSRTRKAWIA